MGLFWLLLLAFLVCSLWWFALRAAFTADSKQRRMAKKLVEEIKSFLGGQG